jgi:glycosyltransferase involved in cell wall biosynthesis
VPELDVLIPTYQRPAALAVLLTCLGLQTRGGFGVIISDQSEGRSAFDHGEVQTAIRFLELRGHRVQALRHLPRRGLAEQRNFLLSRSQADYVLFTDDDLVLESRVVERLMRVIEEQGCGFAGAAPIGLSYRDDVRPHQQAFEPWETRVHPEYIAAGTPEWARHSLHNAANLLHVQQRLGLRDEDCLPYKVAWVGGCVLYDRRKLLSAGGFDFWSELPESHCGEDVLAQLRVMEHYGGCGVMPSGVYHQELPTTVPDRTVDAPKVLRVPRPRLSQLRPPSPVGPTQSPGPS